MDRETRDLLRWTINAKKREKLENDGRNGPNLQGEIVQMVYPGDWMPECKIYPAVSHTNKNRI